jgi:K+-sensing histidine kinase KdpD
MPFDGSEAAERVLRTACRAALEERVSMVVLCVVPISVGGAAEETPPDSRMAALNALVRAAEICQDEGVAATFRETYATNLADEIVRVADRMRAAVIALPLDDVASPSGLMSPTVQDVLAQAHCTVLLQPVSASAPLVGATAEQRRLPNGVDRSG